MKILCIGGGGFIGTNFNFFINKYKIGEILNLDNGDLSTKKFKFNRFDILKNTIEDLYYYFENIDVVINFAAITRVEESILDPFNSFQKNVLIHQKICEGLRLLKKNTSKVPTCIFISTGGAIAGETNNLIDEYILPKPISVYGASKLACEAISFSYVRSFDLDIRNLRLTNVYGPFSNKKQSMIAKFIKSMMSNKTIEIRGDGSMKRDFVYVDDVCKAIILMIKNGKPGQTIQIGSGKSLSINEVYELLKRMKPDLNVKYVPLIHGEVSNVECSISLAKKLLNWEPQTKFIDGLEKTWNFYNKSN